MQLNRVPEKVADAFNRHPVYDKIFSCLSPANLIRLARACKLISNAVQDYHHRAWNVNRCLSRFMSDPVSFRSLQARTATLISGSFALQFFDRTFYPESDLDLYVYRMHSLELGHYLIKDGYKFIPNSFQNSDFEVAGTLVHTMNEDTVLAQLPNQPNGLDEEHRQQYDIGAIAEVYTFIRPLDDEVSPPLKVQIIVPKLSPLECILNFHTTCVMNIITYSEAFALYPYATFERREALAIAASARQGSALRKYSARGWKIIVPSPLITPSPDMNTKLAGHFHLKETRWVVDKKTWTIPLNTDGVLNPPPLSPSSTSLTRDPAAECSWRLDSYKCFDSDKSHFLTSHRGTHTSLLKYIYTVADDEYLSMIIEFLKAQGTLEYSKLPAGEIPEGQPNVEYWTLWDSELSLLRENYLSMPRSTWTAMYNSRDLP